MTNKTDKKLEDKTIKIKGFRNVDFIITKRWLWCEILIEEQYCDKCGDGVKITLHSKDVPKIIKALQKLNKGEKQ